MKKPAVLLIIQIFSVFVFSQNIQLNSGWQFRQEGTLKWFKAEVPGAVHTDLLANGLIPDPFYRDNEKKVQWVEEKAWEYQTVFNVPADLFKMPKITVGFDGLDTYARVFLNGREIIVATNMFRQWTAEVKSILKQKGNKLLVRFQATALVAKEKKKWSPITYPDNERIFVRKAQYQFGWDWGPRLVTCGIWRNAWLKGWEDAKHSIRTVRTRNIKLVTERDSIGESFYFTVDGKPTFIKGANWIPSESFLPRAKKLKQYEKLIRAAKDANINMLRVWGGGVYEEDEFYELCDKYNIMVWQDFMFAGSMYPADSGFLKNIEEEVRYQVQRLRKHPCIAIWCGNNEIEEAWFNWGWQKQFSYSVQDSIKLWRDYKTIFHELIPGILKELDPGRPYWPSSPSLGWGRDSAYKKGDVHYWGVWWGKEPVEKYNEKVGRFVSEYGMQGMPDMKTIQQFSLPQDWDTSSTVMKAHQKHPFGWENIKHYIEQKFKKPKRFEDLVYVSQLMQADAVKTAIEAHRRNEPKTMGTIFWQWNDCWPVTSWSAVDYYGRKKALWYQVRRSYDSILLSGRYVQNGASREISISNHTTRNFVFQTTDTVYRFDGKSEVVTTSPGPRNVEVKSNSNLTFLAPAVSLKKEYSKQVLVTTIKSNDSVIRRLFLFDTPPKDLVLEKNEIRFTIANNELILSADKFAYGVFIDVPDGVGLEDNFFHLLPNERKTIKFTSIIPLEKIKRSITIKSLVDTY